MWHDKNAQLKAFLPLHTVLWNYFIYIRVLRDLRFYMVEQFQSRLVGIGPKRFLFIWSVKIFLSFKLFTTDPQEKSGLPNWFTILYMVIEEILSPTFVTEWTSTGYCKTSDFFFWLGSLVNSPPSLTTLRFPHSSLKNTNLGKPLSFQCYLY